MQLDACVGAQSNQIARVRWDLWFVEDNGYALSVFVHRAMPSVQYIGSAAAEAILRQLKVVIKARQDCVGGGS